MPRHRSCIALIALAAGLLLAALPARAQDGAALADYQAKLAQYTQARQAYDAEADVYWNAVVEKRRARNAKRRSNEPIGLADYVLTQPPVYSGPPQPINPAGPGLEPSKLELEITESVVMADEGWAEKAINQLKQLGVSLAIDDFGTGYSSFGRLRHFAVDRLKIDHSFVKRINECGDDRAIAAAIIAMSRSLRVNVTAEGVENLPQLMFLQEQDCHDAQGFLLSKALSVQDAHALLRRVAGIADGSRTERFKALIG